MLYEFACKIKGFADSEMIEKEKLSELLARFHRELEKPQEVKILILDESLRDAILVKSQVSVSSMPGYLEIELSTAIETFKSYLSKIAEAVGGEIIYGEGFYNNSKTFAKLF
ncbi:MAG: hypothetical protein FWF03_02430 [Defluviitaleaceae bacterium]|nr:hypothetical protein [Defluviitaleaceae bacterium]